MDSYRLRFLDVELTERCNLDCVHCYINRPAADADARSRESPLRLIKRVLREARACGCETVRFTGGEPILHGKFRHVYREAWRAGFKVNLTTNATLITRSLADLFLVMPPTSVTVSFYGWDRESYERTTRVAGSFDAFLAGLGFLRQSGIRFRPNMPAVPWLVANQASVETFARSQGADSGLPFVWDLSLRARRDEDKSRQIDELRPSPHVAVSLILADNDRVQHISKQLAVARAPSRPRVRLFSCRAARDRLTMNAYGELQACLELRHQLTVCDLHECGLENALTSLLPRIREMVAESQDYLRRCSRCRLRSVCGQCPACAFMESGHLDRVVEYYCDITHDLARRLGHLADDGVGWEEPPSIRPRSSSTHYLCNGTRLHAIVRGSGTRVIVIEPGLACSSLEWWEVTEALAQHHRVVLYDRAGYPLSDAAKTERDTTHIARDLHSLLQQLDLGGPFLLIGHSFGGLCVQQFAALFPGETAGLVLVDSCTPFEERLEQLAAETAVTFLDPRSDRGEFARLRRATSAERRSFLGRSRNLGRTSPAIRARVLAAKCSREFWDASLAELASWSKSLGAARDALATQDLRVSVICHSRMRAADLMRRNGMPEQTAILICDTYHRAQEDLAARYPRSHLVETDTPEHHIHLYEPATIVETIRAMT